MNIIKKTLKKALGHRRLIALAMSAATITLLPPATQAQGILVWSTTNFVSDPVGPYGAVNDFQGGENLSNSIVAGNAWEMSFTPTNANINFQMAGKPYPISGNTSANLSDYYVEFDMQVTGVDVSPTNGLQISVFPNQTGPNMWAVFGPNLLLPASVATTFTAGTGYQHYVINLGQFVPGGGFPDIATVTNLEFGMGFVSFPADLAVAQEVFDIQNLQVTMIPAPVAPASSLVVWSTTNFVFDPQGSYGSVVDFQGGENLTLNIVAPGELTGDQAAGDQAMQIDFDPGPNINFQTCTLPYPASGNTNTFLSAYTLSFDLQIIGTNNVSAGSGLQLSLFANKTGASGYYVFGPSLLLPNTVTNVFTAGTGYQHYSFNLGAFNDNSFDVTGTNFCVGIGYVSYPAGLTAHQTFDFAYFQLTMATNPPPPPRPTLNVAPAQPGLRIFQKASDSAFTQEGIGTVDPNQSWVGVATPSTPVSYAITFADFDTVAGYTMNIQLCPGADPGNPYGVYQAQNDLLWTIQSRGGASGFTTYVGFKTNSASNINGGETNVLLATTSTTSTNGRGTWTLTFTSDTHGTVTSPTGVVGSFDLDPAVPAYFVNGLTVLFGTSAGTTGGFGQFIDISRIAITNVVDGNEYDDFTQDDTLNTSLWNPNFSRDNPAYGNDAGSVILVSSNTPAFWINWNIPDQGFGLSTKASLIGGTNAWFSPNYYGSGTGATNTIPSKMGLTQKWTLVPAACLPTVDGTVGGAPSPTAYFRLSNPPPSQ